MERGFRSCGFAGSNRSRWSLAVSLALGLALFVAVPAQAATADSVDQSQTISTSFQRLGLMAQTFTAGMTGQLDKVSLASDTSFGSVMVTITIQSVSATGAPNGTVLGSSAFQGTVVCCRQWHDFVFSPAVHITSGTKYAIVVKVAAGLFTWYDSWIFNAYLGGQLYVGCSGCAWLTGSQYGMDFAFKTWVVTSANQAPTVAADSAGVTVGEGTAPANTGTFSDASGHAVTITASAGTITKSGTSSGTWSWSEPATDEPTSHNVTVTADDGNGLSTTATFSVAVTGVAPTAAINSATFTSAASGLSAGTLTTAVPSSSPEGTKLTLNGSASSPSAADNVAGFTYSWTVTKNGNAFGGGSGPTVSFTPDDEGTFVATLQATDDGGMTGTTSVTIVGANVAPTAQITNTTWQLPQFLVANESVTFAGTFSDPGALDTHTETWNLGDGTTAAGLSTTHSYTTAGTYTVTLTVADDDGGVGTASTKVTVQTPQQALSTISTYVQNIKTLNGGQKNSLIAKLNAASASATRGDITAANHQLNAFLNELQADLSTGKISSTDAATLRTAIHAVQAALGTYNRFLEWWPLGA
jgi:PKD repeat protein